MTRKVFSETLPKWVDTENIGRIKWLDCINIKVPFIYEEIEGEINILDYYPKTEELLVEYNNKEHYINATNFKNGSIGNVIGYKHRKQSNSYTYEVGRVVETHGDGLIQIIEHTKKSRLKGGKTTWEKAYKYKCMKCPNEDIGFSHAIERGVGCGVCNGSKVIKGYNDIATLRSNLIPYFVNKEESELYGINSHANLWFKCPKCETRRRMQVKLLVKRKFNCSMCDKGYSKPNKFALSILSQLNIDFETEKLFNWCRFKSFDGSRMTKGLYDFYLIIDNKKYILEMDGYHHKKGRNGLSAEEQQYIDKTKDELANDNGIEVIRIDCEISSYEYIKPNIIKSKLSSILNLEAVNWDKCKDIFKKQ